MKTVRVLEYGGQLVFEDVPTPTIARDEILVKVKSTAVNHLDLVEASGTARHNATPSQVAAGRRICEIVCVQNRYNLGHRSDDELIDRLADDRIAYVPFYPLGGFAALQSSTLSDLARLLNATTAHVALAWLLRRAPNSLLIPGTSSVAHLRENIGAAELSLPDTGSRHWAVGRALCSIRVSATNPPRASSGRRRYWIAIYT